MFATTPSSPIYVGPRPGIWSPPVQETPHRGMLILRVEGGMYTMYTMKIRRVQDEVYRRFEESHPRPAVVLLDAAATVDTPVTVIDIWLEIDQHLAARAELWIAALPPRAQAKVERLEIYETWVAAGRVHPSVNGAIDVHLMRPA